VHPILWREAGVEAGCPAIFQEQVPDTWSQLGKYQTVPEYVHTRPPQSY
jgi:hypothetical protein